MSLPNPVYILVLALMALSWPWLLHGLAHLTGDAKCGKKWPACERSAS